MSNLIPIYSKYPNLVIQDGGNLILSLAKASQAWEKINIIDHTIKRYGLDPFVEVLDIPHEGILGEDISESKRQSYQNPLIKALALQAFGKIPNPEGKSRIASLSEDDHISYNLLTVLKQEAKNGETALIRWSAAIAIKSIWYDEEWERQGKHYHINVGIEPEKIERTILENQVNRLLSRQPIQRYDYTGERFTVEYEEYLDFWVYGPTWELFNLNCKSDDYKFLVDQVFERLQGRAIWYGLSSVHYYIVEKSLDLVEEYWQQLDHSALIRGLSQFLQHPYSDFRDKVVYILKQHQQHLDEKSTFILKALLYDFSELSQWIKLKERFSLSIAEPAIPTTVNTKAEVLKFILEPFERSILNSISLEQIETYIDATQKDKEYIEYIFSNAIASCESQATEVINLLSSEKKTYIPILDKHLTNLEDKRQTIISHQKDLQEKRSSLLAVCKKMKKDDLEVYDAFISSDIYQTVIQASLPRTYDQYIKKELEKTLNKFEREIQSLQDVIKCRIELKEIRQSIARKMPTIKNHDSEFHQYLLYRSNYQDLMLSSLPVTNDECIKLKEDLKNFEKEIESVFYLRQHCENINILIVQVLKKLKSYYTSYAIKFPYDQEYKGALEFTVSNLLTYQQCIEKEQKLTNLKNIIESDISNKIKSIKSKINGMYSSIRENEELPTKLWILLIIVSIVIIVLASWQILINVVGTLVFRIICSGIFASAVTFILFYIYEAVSKSCQKAIRNYHTQINQSAKEKQQLEDAIKTFSQSQSGYVSLDNEQHRTIGRVSK